MILQFLDIGRYYPPAYYDVIGQAMVYAKVYGMADRLLMLNIKEKSARLMVMFLSRFAPEGRKKMFLLTRSGLSKISVYVTNEKQKLTWISEKIPVIDSGGVSKILRILYIVITSSDKLKQMVMKLSNQDAVIMELSCCLEYGALIEECEELRFEIRQAVQNGEAIGSEELKDYANAISFP